jgi:hypothetical protein
MTQEPIDITGYVLSERIEQMSEGGTGYKLVFHNNQDLYRGRLAFLVSKEEFDSTEIGQEARLTLQLRPIRKLTSVP